MIWKRIGFAIVLIAITVGSLMPSSAVTAANTIALPDWALHGIGYFLLALFATWAMPNARRWLIFIAVVAYGSLIEVLQTMVITRSFDLVDMASNTIGAALGIAAATLTTYRSRSPHQ
jgi:VanZ family protein